MRRQKSRLFLCYVCYTCPNIAHFFTSIDAQQNRAEMDAKEQRDMKKRPIVIRFNGKTHRYTDATNIYKFLPSFHKWRKWGSIILLALVLGGVFGWIVLKTFHFTALSIEEPATEQPSVYQVVDQPAFSVYVVQHGVFQEKHRAEKTMASLEKNMASLHMIKREVNWVIYSDVSFEKEALLQKENAYIKQVEIAEKKIEVLQSQEAVVKAYVDALPALIQRQPVDLSTAIEGELPPSFTNYQQSVDELLTIQEKSSAAYTKQLLQCIEAYEEITVR